MSWGWLVEFSHVQRLKRDKSGVTALKLWGSFMSIVKKKKNKFIEDSSLKPF